MPQPNEGKPRPPSRRLSRKEGRQSLIDTRKVGNELEITPLTAPAPAPAPVITSTKMIPLRTLVCSIGNPAPYQNTFHSAGHNVLYAVANVLGHSSFRKSRAYGSGLLSLGDEFTLWQSASFMNVSGAGVAAAWKQFIKESESQRELGRLVVVHDELELPLGQIKVRKGSASAKGHNGLKSINGLVKGDSYTRIGVGIGRPESREPDVVAGYVLRKMSALERGKIEGCAGKVVEELRKIAGA